MNQSLNFLSPAEQLDLALQRNVSRKWGFDLRDFPNAHEAPHITESDGTFTAVILEIVFNTIEQTFEEAWLCALPQFRTPKFREWEDYDLNIDQSSQPWRWFDVVSKPDRLRLLPGISAPRGIRWVKVDLAANWGDGKKRRVLDVRDPAKSPHVAVFWAAAYSPKWVRMMNGQDVPYVVIPGYELQFSGSKMLGRDWSGVIDISCWRNTIQVGAIPADLPMSEWAIPELL